MKRVLLRLAAFLIVGAALSPVVAMAGSAATRNVEVYRDPSCGCCGTCIRYLRTHAYTVAVHENHSMAALTARLVVPAAAASCHTALIGGYVIEGHVSAQDIHRLLVCGNVMASDGRAVCPACMKPSVKLTMVRYERSTS